MNILAFESSCDETSAAVVSRENDKFIIKSNIIASQIETHRLYGGVVPEIASRAHIEAVSRITKEALDEAGITLADVGAVAVTSHPGLIGALLVGVNFAKSLAYANHIPLVPVNHIHGHVAAAYLQQPDLKPPFLAGVVSGGHTSFYVVEDYTTFTEIGATPADACGEAFDKIGRVIGMPYPGGAALDKLAYEGDPKAFQLPRPRVEGSEYDFSFSGLKTAVINRLHNAEQKGEEVNKADLCASFQHTVTEMLVGNTMKAAADLGATTIVLAGGVSANSGLQKAMHENGKRYGWEVFIPKFKFSTDNAAMIGCAAYYNYINGKTSDFYLNAVANEPTVLKPERFASSATFSSGFSRNLLIE